MKQVVQELNQIKQESQTHVLVAQINGYVHLEKQKNLTLVASPFS